MGATVVDTSLKAATWEKAKPKDYKGSELAAALKGYETVAKSSFAVPKSVPAIKLSEIEGCIDILKDTLAELKKMVEALGKVAAAADKTGADLRKLAKKMEGDQKNSYESAAGVAETMGANARSQKQKLS